MSKHNNRNAVTAAAVIVTDVPPVVELTEAEQAALAAANTAKALQNNADRLAVNAVDLRTAGEAVDTAATPFSRSLLAALLTGVSRAMTESIVVAAYGSPKGANGKTVKGVSGLRNVHGGQAAYQTFKTSGNLFDASADPTPFAADGDNKGKPVGEIIRPMLTLYAEGAKEGAKSLNALNVAVNAILAAHAKAVAAEAGAKEATKPEGEGGDTEAAPKSLGELAEALRALVMAATDADYAENVDALSALSDAIVTRYDAMTGEGGSHSAAEAAETLMAEPDAIAA